MAEINLMDQYPRTKRNIGDRKTRVTDADKALSRQFGKDYFDGERIHGYGGYHYHPRFWTDTVKRFRDHYKLPADAWILDVGCAKGFMLHDFKLLMPQANVRGVDVSKYAIDNAIDTMKPHVRVGNVVDLPYPDKSFDLVIAINVIHNLDVPGCRQALRELQRVSRRHGFLMVDAYRTEEEKKRLEDWVVTCVTYMHVNDWAKMFKEEKYTGDYYWFFAE